MLPFVLRRLRSTIPVLLGVAFCVVLATKLIPGTPGSMKGEKLSQKEIAELDRKYGWDRPFLEQYVSYCARVARGDLGECWLHERPVATELRERFPATAELTLAAMAIAMLAGTCLGVLAAVKPRGIVDYATMTIALVGVSMPVFWLGILLQIASPEPLVERVDFRLSVEGPTGFFLVDSALSRDPALFWDVVKHLALPAVALATIPLATIARLTRASLMEALEQDYVRTARAKGLRESVVVLKHGLRNALIPIVTATGLQLAALLGGAVLTETVFQWPGIGSYIFEAATSKDLPALQGAVLVVAVVFTLANLVVDLSYGVIDPRVRPT
ncbi:ABC transporter permease [bacterium]|nr:ABC transporter permease [bacterium]